MKKNLLLLTLSLSCLVFSCNKTTIGSSQSSSTQQSSSIISQESSSSSSSEDFISSSENSNFSSESSSESIIESSSSVDKVEVTNVKFIVKTINVNLKETATLQWKIYPNNAGNTNVTFKVEDETIATVDQNGLVSGLSVGTTKVTIVTEDGNFTDDATINVIGQQATSIKLIVPEDTLQDEKGTYLLKVNQRIQLSYNITPANSVNTITFSSTTSSGDASNYITVSKGGLLTARKVKTNITISVTTDNLFSDSVTFSVVKDSIYSQTFLEQKLTKSTSIEQEKVISGTRSITRVRPKTSTNYEENETFNIYTNGVERAYTEKDNILNKTTSYEGFNGIYNNNYYQLIRTGSNYSTSYVNQIGDDENQISLAEATKQSSLAYYRSQYGFANIIKNEYINSSYLENSADWTTYEFTEKNNVYTIEASYEKIAKYFGEVSYFRTFKLEITLNDEGMITAFDFESNDYDSSSYDFTSHKLSNNPKSVDYIKHNFTQQVGVRTTNSSFSLHPSQCYFEDYSIVTYKFEDEGNTTNFEVGDYIKYKVDTFTPSTATSMIDTISYVSSSDDNVATYSSMGGLKAVGPGQATLTFASSNNVQRQILINVTYKEATSIEINLDDVGLKVGNTIDNVTASINSGANPNYQLSIIEGSEFATLSYNETSKSYSLTGNSKGKVILQASSIENPNISITKVIYVYENISESDVLSTLLSTKFKTMNGNKAYILNFLENGKGRVVDGNEDYSTLYGTFDYEINGFEIVISNVKTTNSTLFYTLENLTLDESGLILTGKMATSSSTYSKKTYTFTKYEE